MVGALVQLRNRLRPRWISLRNRRVSIGRGTVITGKLTVGGAGRIEIGEGCRITTALIWPISPDSVISIGRDCYLNGPEIAARERVTIGHRCEIGSALIYDTDFHSLQRAPRGEVKVAPVAVGDDVWIAGRTTVLRGVTIGDRAVIGAGAVVAGPVPSDTLVRPAAVRVTPLGGPREPA